MGAKLKELTSAFTKILPANLAAASKYTSSTSIRHILFNIGYVSYGYFISHCNLKKLPTSDVKTIKVFTSEELSLFQHLLSAFQNLSSQCILKPSTDSEEYDNVVIEFEKGGLLDDTRIESIVSDVRNLSDSIDDGLTFEHEEDQDVVTLEVFHVPIRNWNKLLILMFRYIIPLFQVSHVELSNKLDILDFYVQLLTNLSEKYEHFLKTLQGEKSDTRSSTAAVEVDSNIHETSAANDEEEFEEFKSAEADEGSSKVQSAPVDTQSSNNKPVIQMNELEKEFVSNLWTQTIFIVMNTMPILFVDHLDDLTHLHSQLARSKTVNLDTSKFHIAIKRIPKLFACNDLLEHTMTVSDQILIRTNYSTNNISIMMKSVSTLVKLTKFPCTSSYHLRLYLIHLLTAMIGYVSMMMTSTGQMTLKSSIISRILQHLFDLCDDSTPFSANGQCEKPTFHAKTYFMRRACELLAQDMLNWTKFLRQYHGKNPTLLNEGKTLFFIRRPFFNR
jgi:hypothetical protein